MNQEQIDKLKNSIHKNCHYCINYIRSEHDYEAQCTYNAYCSKKENVWNLLSFPFKKEQKCFDLDVRILDYWDGDLRALDDKWREVFDNEEERKKVEYESRELIKLRYWDLLL